MEEGRGPSRKDLNASMSHHGYGQLGVFICAALIFWMSIHDGSTCQKIINFPIMKCFFLLSFCFLRLSAVAQDEKYFSLHRERIKNSKSKNFPIHGVYINRGGFYGYSHAVTFYENGIYCVIGTEFNGNLGPDYNDPPRYLQRMAYIYPVRLNDPERWGFYVIRHDTLIIQRAHLLRFGGLPPYVSVTERWKISDSSLTPVYFQVHNTFFKKHRPIVKATDTSPYVYYPYDKKPDSTYAWFFYKDWYMQTKDKR
jgi:hypothetical protein